MLTITINKNSSGLVDYFTSSLSKDDYFFNGQSISGRWHGQLKHELELPDKVSQKAFSALAHNKHPKTGEKLTARNAAERRASYEFQFAAPKSVSLIMALSDSETGRKILNAHRRSVKKAMEHIEAGMQTQTRINGRKTYVTTGNILYARFDHFTSRPVKDAPAKFSSDPQLHSHCVAFNATKYNGKFQAIEGSTIHRVAGYYEAIYHSHLSKSLKDLGYEIERTKDRWEIKSPGLTRRTIEKFSRRMLQIEQEAKRRKISDPKRKAKLGALTRLSKSKVKNNVDLKKIWLSRLTPTELNAIRNAKSAHQKSPDPMTAKRAIDRALAHHLERDSAVPVKKLLGTALSLGYGDLTLKQMQAELKSRANILYAKRGYLEYLTTKEMVRAEDRIIEYAASGKGKLRPINAEYKIRREFLNDDQRRAVHQILNSPDRVTVLSGAAGVGKTTSLIEIKDAAAQKNKRIVALAPSSGASRGVLASKGFEHADTIAMFLKNKALQEKARGQIILVDEASMVGTKTLNKIFDTCRKVNGRLILSGDVRQHGSINSGSALRQLQDKAGLKIASINKIIRQRRNPAYQKAIELLADGQTRKGFDRLDKLKAVIEVEDVHERHKKIATDYALSLEQRRSTLIVSPTHGEGRLITEAVRAEMKRRGRIKGMERSFIIQRSLSFTESEKQDHAKYEAGMRIQFHQNYKGGYRAGMLYDVVSKDDRGKIMIRAQDEKRTLPLPMSAHERFQAFQKDEIKIATGDLIRITNNGRSLEKSRLHNGQTAIIKGFTSEGHIQLSNGKTLHRNYANFRHGFVETSFAVQGKDCQDILIAQSALSFPASNEKQLYVSASRGSETIRIYTDDKAALKNAVSKSGENITAREIADAQKRTLKNRKRIRNRFYNHMVKTFTKNDRQKERSKVQIHQALIR